MAIGLVFLTSTTLNAASTYGPPTFIPTGAAPVSLAVADFNGDGRLDFASANRLAAPGQEITLNFGDGAGGFSGGSSIAGPAVPQHIAAADMDNDHDVDLVITTIGTLSRGTGHAAVVYRNDGTGAFKAAMSLVCAAPSAVALADVNEDGSMDIVVTSANTGRAPLSLLLSDGSGGFAAPVYPAMPAGTASAHDVVVADFNGDRHADLGLAIAVPSTPSTGVAWMLGNGNGTFGDATVFTFPKTASGEHGAIAIAAADVDEDGDVDTATVAGNALHGASVFLNDGAGAAAGMTWTRFSMPQAAVNPVEVALADLDGDSHLDILTVNQSGQPPWGDSLAARPGLGDGTFGDPIAISVGSTSGLEPYWNPRGIAAADLNCDGKADLIAGHEAKSYASVILAPGGGSCPDAKLTTSTAAPEVAMDASSQSSLPSSSPASQGQQPPAPPQLGLPQQLARGQSVVSQGIEGRAFTIRPEVGYEFLSLRVMAPDGRYFDIKGTGSIVKFDPFGIEGFTPIDGTYTWEARLLPRGAISQEVRTRGQKARESGNAEAEGAMRFALRRAQLVQSGAFTISGGRIVNGQETEVTNLRSPAAAASNRGLGRAPYASLNFASTRAVAASPLSPLRDQVIPDDLIVQGSACIGLDCVNNENFGFDTIRLKENNTRIKFEDTSVGAFPTTDWQLTANDSASGGASKFSIEDITNARIPFTLTALAPTNSLFVSEAGNVGVGTSAPVLDVHANTSDTPGIRLEQNNTGGFTAQTWDVAGNEANFFVRDVTGGSLLSFRIRPGAPTSSIDIASSGKVGIGTGSPEAKLHVFGAATADSFVGIGPNPDGSPAGESGLNFGYGGNSFGRGVGFFNIRPDGSAAAPNPSMRFLIANTERMIIDNEGFIGLGVANPANPIQHSSGAFLSATGVWTDASSRAFKNNVRPLGLSDAKTTLSGLKPVTFTYRLAPSDPHVGFIAEDVPDLVATPDRTGLSAMDIVAVLTRVVQDQQQAIAAQQKAIATQQQTIAELAAKIAALETGRKK